MLLGGRKSRAVAGLSLLCGPGEDYICVHPQCGRDSPMRAGRDDQVKNLRLGSFERFGGGAGWLDQGEVTQKIVDFGAAVVAWSGERELSAFITEMPNKGGGQFDCLLVVRVADRPGSRVVKYDAKATLVFASEFADFQRSGTRSGFP